MIRLRKTTKYFCKQDVNNRIMETDVFRAVRAHNSFVLAITLKNIDFIFTIILIRTKLLLDPFNDIYVLQIYVSTTV